MSIPDQPASVEAHVLQASAPSSRPPLRVHPAADSCFSNASSRAPALSDVFAVLSDVWRPFVPPPMLLIEEPPPPPRSVAPSGGRSGGRWLPPPPCGRAFAEQALPPRLERFGWKPMRT